MTQSANIEKIRWSIITPGTGFVSNYLDAVGVYHLRKYHKNITQIMWVKQQPIIDSTYNLYNPASMIILFLN